MLSGLFKGLSLEATAPIHELESDTFSCQTLLRFIYENLPAYITNIEDDGVQLARIIVANLFSHGIIHAISEFKDNDYQLVLNENLVSNGKFLIFLEEISQPQVPSSDETIDEILIELKRDSGENLEVKKGYTTKLELDLMDMRKFESIPNYLDEVNEILSATIQTSLAKIRKLQPKKVTWAQDKVQVGAPSMIPILKFEENDLTISCRL